MMDGDITEKTNIVLPADIKLAAQKLSASRKISLSQLVTQLLVRAAEERG
jgi:hypothetical protein